MKQILIITDDEKLSDFVSEILKSEEYAVEIVVSAELAIESITVKSFDLVLFDLDFDGNESEMVVSFLKTQKMENLPVVVVGIPQDEVRIIEMLEKGFRDFLFKPFSESILKAKIKKLILLNETFRAMNSERILFKSFADYSNTWESFRDKNNKLIYLSPGMERILGYTREEYISNVSLEDFVYPEDLEIVRAEYNRLLNGETVQSCVFRMLNKNNQIVWTDLSGQPVKSETGEFIGFRLSIRDISRLIEIELALEESRTRYKLISDFSADWEVYRDAEGKVQYCSPSIERILGFTVEEYMMGMTWDKFIHAEDLDRVAADFKKLLTEKHYHRGTYRFVKKDGTIIYLDVTAQTVTTEEGKFLGYRLSGRDVTDKIQLEQELRKLNATKDLFFSIISHDLRSPFNALLGFSELLQNQSDDISEEEKKQYISIIYKTSKSTLNLLENLLMWAQTQSGSIAMKQEKVDLKSFVQEIIDITESAAQKKKITLISLTQDDITVYADVNMLNTILRNLVSNAVKYTPSSGEITINADVKGKSVEISVADTGVGMSKEVKDSLFIASTIQSKPGTESESGTGLGLLLCKEFVEKQGGHIWAESELEKGSIFKFTVPLFEQNQ